MAKTIAATVTKRIPTPDGTGAFYFGTLKPDSEYETGGDTFTGASAPELKLPEKIEWMSISNGGGYMPEYVPSTNKVKFYVGPAAAKEPSQEVAAKKDLSAVTFNFFAYGA